MTTFYVSTRPQYFGSDATDAEAAAWARRIRNAAATRFPEIDFQTTTSEATNDDADPDGAIQQWINDHWTDL